MINDKQHKLLRSKELSSLTTEHTWKKENHPNCTNTSVFGPHSVLLYKVGTLDSSEITFEQVQNKLGKLHVMNGYHS